MYSKTMLIHMANNGGDYYFGLHKDLKALAIGNEIYGKYDFEEAVYAVPVDWLKIVVKEKFNVDDLQYWLENEYTSDESFIIFIEACRNHKINLFEIK